MLLLLTLAGFGLGAWRLARAIQLQGPVDFYIFLIVIFTSLVLVAGYILSAFNYLGSIQAWAVASVSLGILVGIIGQRADKASLLSFQIRNFNMRGFLEDWVGEFRQLGKLQQLTIGICLTTILYLGAINLYFVVKTAPHTWDSMTYHLARMAYYIQRGNLNVFDANYWAQVVHPKNSTLLFIFAFLDSGRNENLTQLVQYIAYWTGILTVYGIARGIGSSRYGSLFAGIVFGLLTESLMQAITTQNDLLIAALFGCAVYGIISWGKVEASRYLVLSSTAIAIAVGVKASSLLAIPCLMILAAAIFYRRYQFIAPQFKRASIKELEKAIRNNSGVNIPNIKRVPREIYVVIAAILFSSLLFILPAGYLDNWQLFSHPIGPSSMRAGHSFEGQDLNYILENGSKNIMRYAVEFASLDGMHHPKLDALQLEIRQQLKNIFLLIGIDLENTAASRNVFQYLRLPDSHEDHSSWGIFGFLLIWPLALISLFKKFTPRPFFFLSVVSFLFLLLQAFAGPYDPWRGRYFLVGAIYATPVLSFYFQLPKKQSNRWLEFILPSYIFLVTVIGCMSALSAVMDRRNSNLHEVRQLDRLGQLIRNTGMTAPIRLFNQLVPNQAIVAVALPGDNYEFALFGEGLTRTLIPINDFTKGLQPIPKHAEYLLFSKWVIPNIEPTDTALGEDWYLRRLKVAGNSDQKNN